MPQNSRKKDIFWYFWTISPTRMGILIWLGAFFQTKTLGHYFVYVQAFVYLFGSIWACPNAPKQPFFGCFGYFLLQEWAY